MTTSSISTFCRIAPMLPAETSILLRGPHGIGKSQVVRQVAKAIAKAEDIKDFIVIDRRLSQMSEGDMIGLPSTDGEVTRFNPPDWYKQACKVPCVLFLDELNRATPEVMQAAFQIVLDRELNGWRLHPQTRVFSAINNSAAYTVNEVDPALLDRFWVVDIEPTSEEWLSWARGFDDEAKEPRVDETVTDFIAQSTKFLFTPKNFEPGTVHVSPRSWERLSNALRKASLADKPDTNDYYSMSIGFVGTEASIAFVEFAKNSNAHITGEEILANYTKAKKRLSKLGQERLNIAVEKVFDYMRNDLKGQVDDNHKKNFVKFVVDLPAELQLRVWSMIATAEPNNKNYDHVKLASALLTFDNKKLGQIIAKASQMTEEKKQKEDQNK